LAGGIIKEADEEIAWRGHGGAVRLERGEEAPEEHFPVWLHGHTQDFEIRIRIKAGVEGAIGIDARNAIPRGGRRRPVRLERGEVAAQEHFSIRL